MILLEIPVHGAPYCHVFDVVANVSKEISPRRLNSVAMFSCLREKIIEDRQKLVVVNQK